MNDVDLEGGGSRGRACVRREERQTDQSRERKRRRVKNAGARWCVQYMRLGSSEFACTMRSRAIALIRANCSSSNGKKKPVGALASSCTSSWVENITHDESVKV